MGQAALENAALGTNVQNAGDAPAAAMAEVPAMVPGQCHRSVAAVAETAALITDAAASSTFDVVQTHAQVHTANGSDAMQELLDDSSQDASIVGSTEANTQRAVDLASQPIAPLMFATPSPCSAWPSRKVVGKALYQKDNTSELAGREDSDAPQSSTSQSTSDASELLAAASSTVDQTERAELVPLDASVAAQQSIVEESPDACWRGNKYPRPSVIKTRARASQDLPCF